MASRSIIPRHYRAILLADSMVSVQNNCKQPNNFKQQTIQTIKSKQFKQQFQANNFQKTIKSNSIKFKQIQPNNFNQNNFQQTTSNKQFQTNNLNQIKTRIKKTN